jgi:Fe-S-cluster containining protein
MTDEVPCGRCTACCRAFAIWLEPSDNAMLYRTAPVQGRPERQMLARRDDGACWYLTPKGCGIYEMRPRGCRRFDCRTWVERFPDRAARKNAVRLNPAAEAVIARGRELRSARENSSPHPALLPDATASGSFQGALA